MSAQASMLVKLTTSSIRISSAAGTINRGLINRVNHNFYQNHPTSTSSWIFKRNFNDASVPFLKDHTCVTLGKKDLNEVLSCIRDHFVPYEPLQMGLSATFEDVKEFFTNMMSVSLEGDFCMGVKNIEGKLIGLYVADLKKAGDSYHGYSSSIEDKNEKVMNLINILNHVEESYAIFSKQGVSEVLYFNLVIFDPAYKGTGIPRKLAYLLEEKAKEKGINVCYVIPTSIASQISSGRYGFEKVYEVPYAEFDCLDLEAMGDNTCIQYRIKKLTK